MEKISALISKKVFSMSEVNQAGYILNLVFDDMLTKLQGFEVVDQESENTFFLDMKDVVAVGKDCVMIESLSCLKIEFFTANNNPLGKNIYDRFGTYFGRVREVETNGKTVKKIITNKCEILPKNIKKIGDDFILFSLDKKKKKNKIQQNLEKIKINNEKNDKFPQIIALNEFPIEEKQNNVLMRNQMRQHLNYSSLLGKIITSDVFGLNNELIARKNEIINKKIIESAKIHNKLNLLAHFSR